MTAAKLEDARPSTPVNSVSATATARPSTPDNSTRINLTVPASDVAQDIDILLTPKKPTSRAEPLRSEKASVAAKATFPVLPDIILEESPLPIEDFLVPTEYLERYPPTLPRGPGKPGWVWKRWYVVKTGRHPGVYMDYWGNVHALVNVTGGYAKRVESYHDAQILMRHWMEKKEITKVRD